ncbi:MAG: hypothetical protein ACT4PG_12325 [Panacagrimonas sp.]
MARKPKQKPPQPEAPKSFDDVVPFETDSVDDDPAVIEPEVPVIDSKSRDWRDVERYKEMRQLRKLVDDDLDIDLD